MLTERQMLILQVIIDDFIQTAQPVGSRAISKKDHISYSAATIRNVMADLEDMGYLEKTHSSSGRIPSEQGYRFYVDHLLHPNTESEKVHVLEHFLQDGILEFEQIVQRSAEVLSELTSYTTIILGPGVFDTKLEQIQLIPISNQTAVAILVTNTGHVEHRAFSIPNQVDAQDLEKMVNILNDRLYGVPIIQLGEKLDNEVMMLMKKYVHDFEQSFAYLKAAFFSEHQTKLYVGGKANMLMQPEFHDIERVRSFYTMMEDEDEIVKIMKAATDGIKVTIGHENKIDAIKDLSLITATYHLDDEQMGTIALLGPTRMEYRKVISLLNTISNEMTNTLYRWYNKQ